MKAGLETASGIPQLQALAPVAGFLLFTTSFLCLNFHTLSAGRLTRHQALLAGTSPAFLYTPSQTSQIPQSVGLKIYYFSIATPLFSVPPTSQASSSVPTGPPRVSITLGEVS